MSERATLPEVCSYCAGGRAGCFCGALADAREAQDLVRRVEEALREYPSIPEETFIGREDLAARVTWLARRAAMLEIERLGRLDPVKVNEMFAKLSIECDQALARCGELERENLRLVVEADELREQLADALQEISDQAVIIERYEART